MNGIYEELDHFITKNYVSFDEYQDKFYLKKKIQEILPDKMDNEIYNAIELANSTLKPPRSKREYINMLVANLK